MSLKGVAFHRPYEEQAPQLTAREREILALVGQAKSNQEIADVLGISVRTVRVHMQNIFDKVGVHDRHEAARVQEAVAP